MATELHTVKGTVYWAKVFESNRDAKKFDEDSGTYVDDPEGGNYTIDVALEPDEFKKLKRTKSMLPRFAKENEAGLDVVRFKRPHKRLDRSGNLMDWACGPVEVVDAFDQPWDLKEQGFINNESECEIQYEVYTTKLNPGTRLKKVKVLQLAEREDASTKASDEVPF